MPVVVVGWVQNEAIKDTIDNREDGGHKTEERSRRTWEEERRKTTERGCSRLGGVRSRL
jgi:hypothetical protein